MAMAATTTMPQRFGALPVVRKLKRSNGKRVSWASADQLCQIRMFLAEDAPFLAGVAQEQLQVKSSSFMHLISDLPPGFGGAFGRVGGPPSKMNAKPDVEFLVANVAPAIPWQCPQKMELEASWRVEAGAGSHEVVAQKQRESTTLEAIYPRSSAIPNCPVEPLDQGALVDERSIPVIPVSAPDEDSDGEDTPPAGSTGAKVPVIGLNSAAAAAVSGGYFGPGSGTMSEKSSEKDLSSGSSAGIDTNLLLQLLANPSLVATLSGLQQQNQSMVNSPNGNLVVTPNQAAIVGSAANLTSLTSPLSSSAATSITNTTTSNVSPSSVSSSVSSRSTPAAWLQAPEVAAHQQYQPQFVQQPKPGNHQQQQMSSAGPPGFQQQQFMMQQQQQGRGGRDDEKYYKELIMQHGGAASGGGGGRGRGGFGQPGTVHHRHQQRGGAQSHDHHHQNHQQQNHHQQQHHKKNGYGSNGQHHPPGFGVLAEANGGPAGGGGGGGGGGGPRGRRVCSFYNTAKGCRNGMKCPFIHDANKRPGEVMNQQHHKRMRGGGFPEAAAPAAATAAGSGDRERF